MKYKPKQTWEELEYCGHSPRMIEATLSEQGSYDDEQEEDNDEV